MMRGQAKRVLSATSAIAFVVIASGAWTTAADQTVKARLFGLQEVPSISSTGSGEFEAKIGDAEIEYTLSYENLEGPAPTQAHIHFGQHAVNGGIMAFLCGGGDKPPCPATSGTGSGVIDPTDIIGPAGQGIAPGEFAEVVEALKSGNSYANVHTAKHPGGEIRGQIRGDRDSKN